VTGAERAAVALMVSCGFCWARPGAVCEHQGLHLARYVRAYRRGLISQQELAVICGPLAHVSAGQVVAQSGSVQDPPWILVSHGLASTTNEQHYRVVGGRGGWLVRE
jgi:hypothetical protein